MHVVRHHHPRVKTITLFIEVPPVLQDGFRTNGMAKYAATMTSIEVAGVLHLKRSLRLDMLMVSTKYYGAIQSFYDGVRTGDELQAVLLPRDSGAKH